MTEGAHRIRATLPKPAFELPRGWRPAFQAFVVIVVAAAATVGASKFSAPVGLTVVTVLGLLTALATQSPRRAAFVSMVAIALLPVYWAPLVPGTKSPLLPAVAASIVLLPVALRYRSQLRVTAIDRLFGAYLFFRIASLIVNSVGVGAVLDTLLQVALPYAVFRLISLRVGVRATMAFGVVAAGVVSAVIAVREYNGIRNPFFGHKFGGYQYSYYSHGDYRFGHPRPEASFGQANALGLFLAIATVLAIVLAWRSTSVWRRYFFYGLAFVIVTGLFNTLVRGPLIAVAVAVAVALLGDARRLRMDRTAFVVVTAFVLLTVGSLSTNLFLLRDATVKPGAVQNSSNVRLEIVDAMTRSDNFSLLGKAKKEEGGAGFQEELAAQVGLRTFENAFALVYLGYGVFAFIAFAGLFGFVLRASLTGGIEVIDRGWCAALVGVFVGLLAVGLTAQFTEVFWIGIAVVAAIVQAAPRAANRQKGLVAPSDLTLIGASASAPSR